MYKYIYTYIYTYLYIASVPGKDIEYLPHAMVENRKNQIVVGCTYTFLYFSFFYTSHFSILCILFDASPLLYFLSSILLLFYSFLFSILSFFLYFPFFYTFLFSILSSFLYFPLFYIFLFSILSSFLYFPLFYIFLFSIFSSFLYFPFFYTFFFSILSSFLYFPRVYAFQNLLYFPLFYASFTSNSPKLDYMYTFFIDSVRLRNSVWFKSIGKCYLQSDFRKFNKEPKYI